jgi:ISXO2-like transposase domain
VAIATGLPSEPAPPNCRIEVDESYLSGPTPGGKRGRGAEGNVIIAIAAERKGLGKKSKRWKPGRARIQVVPDVKAKTLLEFVEDTFEQGSTIYIDGLSDRTRSGSRRWRPPRCQSRTSQKPRPRRLLPELRRPESVFSLND